MNQEDQDCQDLLQTLEAAWRAMRSGEAGSLNALLHPQFRAGGYPTEVPPETEPWRGASAGSTSSPDSGAEPSPAVAAQRLAGLFREGSGLTNLHHVVEGAQKFGEFGVAQLRWMAEWGLGEGGSPRFVSGRATVSFRREKDSWLLAGWLGVSGPHGAQDAARRASDVEAIREQILRVFEAYRQKDQAMLRRTHTADWRGFALSSSTVGKGIDAYMGAAARAMASVQFEEYQIAELDAIFYGDIAIVPYLAVVAGRTAQGRREQSRLRVIDVYLREPSGWNQVASNVCLHPETLRSMP